MGKYGYIRITSTGSRVLANQYPYVVSKEVKQLLRFVGENGISYKQLKSKRINNANRIIERAIQTGFIESI